MPELPPITVPDIRNWVSDRNLNKGQPYYRSGALRNPRRQGLILRAGCQGTSPTPYEVEIQLGADGIASGTCSCPVGYGGRCKHGAALLLAWLHQPDMFVEVVDVVETLAALDHDQLARVVTQLYGRFPEVKSWLDLELTQLVRAATPAAAPLIAEDALDIVSGVSRALDEARTFHQDAQILPSGVSDVLAAAYDTAAMGDHARAATLFTAVIEGATDALNHTLEDMEAGADDDYDDYGRAYRYEEDGYFRTLAATRLSILALDDAVPGLGDSLEHLVDPSRRAPLLDQLYGLLTIDVESYVLEGAAFPDSLRTILSERSTPDERRSLIARLQAGRPAGDWSRKTYDLRYGGLLLALAHGLVDDDAYLALCRELGALESLLDELLWLGRADDAVAELRTVPHPLSFAGVFTRHGQDERFFVGVRHLPTAETTPQLVTWLRDRAAARSDLEDALTLARHAFDVTSSTADYRALRDIAIRLNRWESLRASIFERARKASRWPTLTDLHLEEHEIDHALEALKHVAQSHGDPLYSSAMTLQLKVAATAEATRPEDAIALYVAAVERIVSFRGRAYYSRAAELLGRVRAVYRAQGQGDAWQMLIAHVRDEYRRLPALRDELTRAKLFDPEPKPTHLRSPAASVALSVAPRDLPPQASAPEEQEPLIHPVRAPGGLFSG